MSFGKRSGDPQYSSGALAPPGGLCYPRASPASWGCPITAHGCSTGPAGASALRRPAVLLLSALLGACSSATPPASQPARGAAPAAPASQPAATAAPAATSQPTPAARDPLRVVYVTRNGAMAPMWIAHEAGIFARNGLETEMIYISSGTLGMQALLAKLPNR